MVKINSMGARESRKVQALVSQTEIYTLSVFPAYYTDSVKIERIGPVMFLFIGWEESASRQTPANLVSFIQNVCHLWHAPRWQRDWWRPGCLRSPPTVHLVVGATSAQPQERDWKRDWKRDWTYPSLAPREKRYPALDRLRSQIDCLQVTEVCDYVPPVAFKIARKVESEVMKEFVSELWLPYMETQVYHLLEGQTDLETKFIMQKFGKWKANWLTPTNEKNVLENMEELSVVLCFATILVDTYQVQEDTTDDVTSATKMAQGDFPGAVDCSDARANLRVDAGARIKIFYGSASKARALALLAEEFHEWVKRW